MYMATYLIILNQLQLYLLKSCAIYNLLTMILQYILLLSAKHILHNLRVRRDPSLFLYCEPYVWYYDAGFNIPICLKNNFFRAMKKAQFISLVTSDLLTRRKDKTVNGESVDCRLLHHVISFLTYNHPSSLSHS